MATVPPVASRTWRTLALPASMAATAGVGLALMAVVGGYLATHSRDEAASQTLSDVALLAAVFAGTVFCARAARRRTPDSRGWLFLTIAFLCFTFGAAVTAFYGITRDHVYPSPSVADIGFLLYPIPTIAALLAFPKPPALLISRVRAALDAAVIALGVLFVSVATVLDAVMHSLGVIDPAELVMLAYPLIDVVICSVVLTLGMRQRVGQRLIWLLMGCGMLALALTDSVYFFLLAADGGTALPGTPVVVGWMAAVLLVALATLAPHPVPTGSPSRRSGLLLELIPYLPMTAAVLLVGLQQVHRHPLELWVGGLLFAGLVLRQIMILLENVTLTSNLERKVDELNSLGSIVTSSRDAIVGISVDGLVTSCNSAAEELFGIRAATAVGHPPVFHRPGREQHLHQMIARAQRGEKLDAYETEWQRSDGRVVQVAMAASPIYLGTVFRGISFSGHDISERLRVAASLEAARTEALESSRLKSEFLATMSHEIRTPMNGVIGLTDLLLETSLDPTQRQYAEGVHTAGEALLTVINDVLDFSKLEAGKVELDLRPFAVRKLVEEVAGLLAPVAYEKKLELLAYCLPDVPDLLRGDRGRIRQILLNLASNAVKFTSSGEVAIKVSCSTTDDGAVQLRFEVSDTGIGVADHQRKLLFNSFSQADASTTRRYGGTGLGLAISLRLVEAMSGRIDVDSQAGSGSTFWFELPLTRETAATGTSPPPGPEPLAGLRALVVDDNATNRQILQSHLASWRLEVDLVGDARTALVRLHAMATSGTSYDLAVIDRCMPEVDGLQLASAISADPMLKDLRLMILSSTSHMDTGQLLQAGVGEWLTKPVRSSELYDRLIRLMAPQLDSPSRPDRDHEPRAEVSRFRGRVLVVEDNPLNQLVAEGIVTHLGYEVKLVGNGAEALTALHTGSYAAVLMDCHMPVMDGFEAAREIRRRKDLPSDIPIIAMTAGAMVEDRERCLAAGMNDYIAKPVAISAVKAALEKWVTVAAAAEPATDDRRNIDLPQLGARRPG